MDTGHCDVQIAQAATAGQSNGLGFCHEYQTFGCAKMGTQHEPTLWVSFGCAAVFRCNNVPVACGYDNGKPISPDRNQTCTCTTASYRQVHFLAEQAEALAPCSPPRFLTVQPDWNGAACQTTQASHASRLPATNALEAHSFTHHPIFSKYRPWRGKVRDAYLVDFLGVSMPHRLYCNRAYLTQPVAHAIRAMQCKLHDRLVGTKPCSTTGACIMQTSWPVVSEEYFEYIDVLRAVEEYARATEANDTPQRPFTFVELGAGYGHWSLTAHRALQQLAPSAKHRYLLVDIVDSLRPAVLEAAKENGVESNSLHWHTGFISWYSGNATAVQKSDGMSMINTYSRVWGVGRGSRTAARRSDSLARLLALYNMPQCLDMVDIDVQGSEYDLGDGRQGIFHGDELIELLTRRARRVHIGMHKNHLVRGKRQFSYFPNTAARQLLRRFVHKGWVREWFFATGKQSTDWGTVHFGDGVLSVRNEMAPACSQHALGTPGKVNHES